MQLTLSTVAKLSLLAPFVLSATYVHFRGTVRHRFRRQVLDHSSIMAPYNTFVYWRSAVPNTPMLDVAEIPDLALLRNNWETIRDEALALKSGNGIGVADATNDLAFNSFFNKGWKRFYLKWYRDYLPSALEQCPRTVEVLRRTPSVKAAMFAMLEPHSRLGAHRDPFAGSLRYHLGLSTPNSDECRIFVDGIEHSWRDGEDVLFDETYIHWAENNTDQYRVILFCDVERPLRGRVSRAINRAFGRVAVAAAASRNRPDEKLGALNHVFGYVYAIRRAGLWLKNRNQRLYYLVKWALIAAIVLWIAL